MTQVLIKMEIYSFGIHKILMQILLKAKNNLIKQDKISIKYKQMLNVLNLQLDTFGSLIKKKKSFNIPSLNSLMTKIISNPLKSDRKEL